MNYIVIDTETTNGFDDPMVYDCGWAVIDKEGRVLKARSYVIADVFCEKELMEDAFFADKIETSALKIVVFPVPGPPVPVPYIPFGSASRS